MGLRKFTPDRSQKLYERIENTGKSKYMGKCVKIAVEIKIIAYEI